MPSRSTPLIVLLLSAIAYPVLAEELDLYSDAEEDRFVELGKPDNIGNMIVWSSPLETKDGTVVGTNSGSCIRLDEPGNYMCTMVIEHEGKGQISFAGVQEPEPAPSSLVITGGTETYRGVTGRLISTPVEDRARFRFRILFER